MRNFELNCIKFPKFGVQTQINFRYKSTLQIPQSWKNSNWNFGKLNEWILEEDHERSSNLTALKSPFYYPFNVEYLCRPNYDTSLIFLVDLINDNTDFRWAENSSSLRSLKSPNVLRLTLEKIGHLHIKCSTAPFHPLPDIWRMLVSSQTSWFSGMFINFNSKFRKKISILKPIYFLLYICL